MSTPEFEITGMNLVAGRPSAAGRITFSSTDPRTLQPGDTPFREASQHEVADAAAVAAQAFASWKTTPPRARATFLRAVAAQLESWREPLVALADRETGLGAPRLEGELTRTAGQILAFADLLDEGSYVEAILSLADPKAAPPRPDVRRMLVPIGPVAVFPPSNFPLAFGAAGGDTASALAAGCPVVVKGHPSHPGTSEGCTRAILAAAEATGAPRGVIALLQARDIAIGRGLVEAPEIQAVGFTGSHVAGRSLHDVAAARPQPIPVYAEMGSLNPLFVSPGALAARASEIAEGLAASMTTGTGQFCTKPGIVFVPDDEAGRAFARLLAERVASRDPGVMLNPPLFATLRRQMEHTLALAGVERLTPERPSAGPGLSAAGCVLTTTASTFLRTPALSEEHFGPVSLVVRCAPHSMADVAGRLHGNLTATLHAEPNEREWAARLAAVLVERAGRVVWNGFPTGVAVVPAMQHGGPYPASTSALHTSVGATAIRRFLRPVAFQEVPDALLPEALADANPLGIQRLVGGRWTREPVSRTR